MVPTLDPEYSKMLSTPVPLEGPRKDTIDSLQKQIDFYLGEANRLKCVQNSHVAISRLPAELLSDVFLYVVEAGLQMEDTSFAVRTFAFLQVCRLWNEIGIGSPRLWVWLIPGTFNAWRLFKSRSKDAPLFLTWRTYLREPTQKIFTDTETPKRIRQLDFIGTREDLEHILDGLDSRSTSITSSIRLRGTCHKNNGEHLTRFFSLSFPELSKLDIDTFLPDSASSILITSNLTSLKINLAYNDDRRYTQSQFLQVLQQHPNLKQLDLTAGGFPSVENSGGLTPVVLPHLIDLRLCGRDNVIGEFVDLVSMSSPLHNVVIDFKHNNPTAAELATTAKKLLTAYYGCKGLEHPRRATHLTASSFLLQDDLIISAKSPSTSTSHPTYNIELRLRSAGNGLAQKIITLFPLKQVREYDTEGLRLIVDAWSTTLRKMKGLLHLRLGGTDVSPALDALNLNNKGEPDQIITPKLKSLSFCNVHFLYDSLRKLLAILEDRRAHDVGLKSLVLRSCTVPTLEYKTELAGLVEKLTWEHVGEMESDYSETDTEDESDFDDDYGYWPWLPGRGGYYDF